MATLNRVTDSGVLPGMHCTPEQVHFFRHSGYLQLPSVVGINRVTLLKGAILDDARKGVHPILRDESGCVSRLDNVIHRDRAFLQTFTSPEILDPLESLLGPNIELTLNRHNHATLNFPGMPSRLHRDVLQWSRTVITAILYLEDSSEVNGCTRIIPGSQYLSFVGKPNNGGTWMDEHDIFRSLLAQDVCVPMKAGGVLLFDSCAFHSCGANNSVGTRMSITMAYRSVDELDGRADNPQCLLVRGERVYKGNDRRS